MVPLDSRSKKQRNTHNTYMTLIWTIQDGLQYIIICACHYSQQSSPTKRNHQQKQKHQPTYLGDPVSIQVTHLDKGVQYRFPMPYASIPTP